MGILSPSKDGAKTPTSTTKRKSIPKDFSNLGPLHTFGTVGFAGYRDSNSTKNGKRKDEDEMDSDQDDDDEDAKRNAVEEANPKEDDKKSVSPEETAKQERLAEGVRQIKVRLSGHKLNDRASNTSIAQTCSLCRA